MFDRVINKFLFQPPGPLPSIQLSARMKEMKTIEVLDTKVYYLHFKGGSSASNGSSERITILYSHGNAEDLGTCYNQLRAFTHYLKVDIVVYDYCGYGFSRTAKKEKPNEKQVYRDADAIYDEITGPVGVPPNQIILMGHSVGGGAACYLAKKHHSEIAGLILSSTFTSVFGAVGWRCLGCIPCIRDPFPNEKCLRHVSDCPILVLHGDEDRVVKFSCGKKLVKAIRRAQATGTSRAFLRYHWFKGCGHNDIDARSFGELLSVLRGFIEEVTMQFTLQSQHTEEEVVKLPN